LGGGERGGRRLGISALEIVWAGRRQGLRKVFLKEFCGRGFGIKIFW